MQKTFLNTFVSNADEQFMMLDATIYLFECCLSDTDTR